MHRAGYRSPMSRGGSVRSPHRHLQALEAAWLPAELAGFAAVRPWLAALPRGDGHPVLVLPGFTAGDDSTVALRRVLRERGYWAHRWRLGNNVGPTARMSAACGIGWRSSMSVTGVRSA